MQITVEPQVALTYLAPAPNIKQGYLSADLGNYIISLNTLLTNWQLVENCLINGGQVTVEKTDEGISTLWHIVTNQKFEFWIKNKQLRFITSSNSDPGISNLNAEHFLAATIGSQENINNIKIDYPTHRPYTFLFTNRKLRPHRKYLIVELQKSGLLDSALWSCLEVHDTVGHPEITEIYKTDTPINSQLLLPAGYDPIATPAWIDGIIYPMHFQHTWFSLVTETNFDYPYSFRTEKIYKPILAAHPFIVCANAGFYQDLRNLGFKTFDHLIDESFDSIINNTQRLRAIVNTVEWLCKQNLKSFWQAAQDICLYNQQHALAIHNSHAHSFNKKLTEFIHA
jgi:hypothetical protein